MPKLLLSFLFLLGGFSALASNTVKSYLDENRYEEAAQVCRQQEGVGFGDSASMISCAWAYYRQDKLDSGDRLMEKVRSSSSSSLDYQLLAVFSQMKRRQFEGARKTLTPLVQDNKQSPMYPTIQELSAELYEMNNQLDTAAFLYKQILADFPNRGRAHWGLARYYLGRSELGRARSHLEETAKLWPKHLSSRYNLAVLSLQSENLVEAARWLTESYRINRNDPGVLEQLGVLFEKKGFVQEAVKYWQKALAIQKDSPLAKEKLSVHALQLIDSLIATQKYEEAMDQIRQMPQAMAKEQGVLVRRGMVYRNLGKFDLAIRDLTTYLEKNPKDPAALRELGICYVNLKLLDKAFNRFADAAELEPNNGLNYAWSAYILESKGKLPQALEAWKRAAELLTDVEELGRAQSRLTALQKRLGKGPKKKSRSTASDDDDEAHEREVLKDLGPAFRD